MCVAQLFAAAAYLTSPESRKNCLTDFNSIGARNAPTCTHARVDGKVYSLFLANKNGTSQFNGLYRIHSNNTVVMDKLLYAKLELSVAAKVTNKELSRAT